MMGKTAKQAAIDLIERLPDEVSSEGIIAAMQFNDDVKRGLGQLDKGKVVSHNKAKEILAPWLRLFGPGPR